MGKPSQTKPPWDESKSGTPTALYITGKRGPAFGPPTTKELKAARKQIAEAQKLSKGLGAGEMSGKQRWLEQARSRANLHRMNLEHFINATPKRVGGSKRKNEQIRIHRYGLVIALRDLGLFQEAILLATTGGRARPGFKRLADQITDWAEAVARPDGEDCGCEPRTHDVPLTDHPNSKTVTIKLNRRHRVIHFYSMKHQKVVDLWRCSVCRTLNAHDLGAPDSQGDKESLRAQFSRGKTIPDPKIHADTARLKL